MKKTLIILPGIMMLMAGVGFASGKYLVPEDIKQPKVAAVESVGEGAVDDSYSSEEVKANEEVKSEPDPIVVELGRVMVPIYKTNVITYVIADMGLSLTDEKKAEEFQSEKGTAKIKNDILAHMISISEKGAFSGATVDTEYLSFTVHKHLQELYPEIEEVLFLSLIKQDVARG